MAVSIRCKCGKVYKLDETHRGKKVKCTECERSFLVPQQKPAARAAVKPAVPAPAPPPATPAQAPPPAAGPAKPAAVKAAVAAAAPAKRMAPKPAVAAPAPPRPKAAPARVPEPVAPQAEEAPLPVRPARARAARGRQRGRTAVMAAGILLAVGVVAFTVHSAFNGRGKNGGRPAADAPSPLEPAAASAAAQPAGASAAKSLTPPGGASAASTGARPGGAAEAGAASAEPPEEGLSPLALVPDREGKSLYVAEYTGRRLAILDVSSGKVTKVVPLPDRPGGLLLAPDGKRLYVTGASPEGRVHVVDTSTLALTESLPVGHTPGALAVSPDGTKLYVCNRFHNDVSVVDVAARKETARIAVLREPVAAVLTADGKYLFVANHLPAGPASGDYVAAAVTVIETGSGAVAGAVQLPNGSTSLRGICLSPDGQFVYVTHILARYHLPTTQLERGWMNTNALSVIAVADRKLVNTVLLDNVDLGAANPWGVACTPDGKYLCVAHAGTHEVSVIDRAALHEKLTKAAAGQQVSDVTSSAADVPSDLAFMTGLRRRIALGGHGPRGLAVSGTKIYAAEYFSDSVSVVDAAAEAQPALQTFALGPQVSPSPARRGEMLFSDADRCFQKWQSCASCHPDGRADGLNWDLLNDGLGNPKNTKNMLLAFATPPVMSLAVRGKMEDAVRAGFRFIQFTNPPEEEFVAVGEYLKAMQPVPSPHLVKGQLSPAARRGQEVYTAAGCANCHPPPLYTDLKRHELGLGAGLDKAKAFDTPTLCEVWRTAPYLYDGRAATLKEALTSCNQENKHGQTTGLSAGDLEALLEYVLSQ